MLPAHLINQLKIDDLPNDQVKRLAEICGMETAVKIMTSFVGQNIYCPKYWIRNCLPKLVDLMLEAEAEPRQIIKTLGISRTQLYRAMNMDRPARPPAKKKTGPEQLNFFNGNQR